MAKLTRYKSSVSRGGAPSIGPVGVVAMTGLRQQAQSFEGLSQAADMVRGIAVEELSKERVQKAEQDYVNKTLNLPSQNINDALGDDTTDYAPDAQGVPEPVSNMTSQIARKQVGLFSNSYVKRWNELADQHNYNQATIDIQGTLKGFEAEYMASNNFDFKGYHLKGTEYIKSTLETVNPQVRARVMLEAEKAFNTGYQNIRAAHLAKVEKDWDQSWAAKHELMLTDIETASSKYGVNDAGTQRLFYLSARHHVDKLNARKSTLEETINNISLDNSMMVRGEIIRRTNEMLADGKIDEAETLQLDQFIADLQSGRANISGYVYDLETGTVSVQEMNVNQFIPDPKSRDAFFSSLRSLVDVNRNLTIAGNKIDSTMLENGIYAVQSNYLTALQSGNSEQIKIAKDAMDGFKKKILESTVENRSDLLWKYETQRIRIDGVADSYAKEGFQANVLIPRMNENIEAGMAMLDPVNRARISRTWGLDDEDAQELMRQMDAGDRLQYKANILTEIQTVLTAMTKPPTAADELRTMMRTGRNDTSEKFRDAADIEIGRAMTLSGMEWKPMYMGSGGQPEWEQTMKIAAPFINTGNVPTSLAQTMRGAMTGGSNPEVLAAYKMYQSLRDNPRISYDQIEAAIGKDAMRAFGVLHARYDISQEFPLSDLAVQSARDSLNAQESEMFKMTREQTNTARSYFEDKTKLFLRTDDPRIPSQMMNDLLTQTTYFIEQEGYDFDSAQEKAWSRMLEGVKSGAPTRWGLSEFGINDRWNRYPAETAYRNLSTNPGFMRRVLRNKITSMGGMMVGDEIIDSFHLPGDPTNIISDGSIEFRLAFDRRGSTSENGGLPIYKILAVSTDETVQGQIPVYSVVTDADGMPVQVDLSEENNLEGRRQDALVQVDNQLSLMDAREAAAEQEYYSMTASTGIDVTEETFEIAKQKLRPKLAEIEADREALRELKRRLQDSDRRISEAYLSDYMGESLRTKMAEITTQTQLVTEEEIKAQDTAIEKWMRRMFLETPPDQDWIAP